MPEGPELRKKVKQARHLVNILNLGDVKQQMLKKLHQAEDVAEFEKHLYHLTQLGVEFDGDTIIELYTSAVERGLAKFISEAIRIDFRKCATPNELSTLIVSYIRTIGIKLRHNLIYYKAIHRDSIKQVTIGLLDVTLQELTTGVNNQKFIKLAKTDYSVYLKQLITMFQEFNNWLIRYMPLLGIDATKFQEYFVPKDDMGLRIPLEGAEQNLGSTSIPKIFREAFENDPH